ncbi:MAG: metalloregulator ArsR/SmtB family transcription factor [Eubacterium sp.]|nr:metalloregulator ArsR/SmtB family transcription factor [Eubacterium sp.]
MEFTSLPHNHGTNDCHEFLRKELNKQDRFTIAAEIAKQLGDSARIRIFWILCHYEECVINISALMEMSSPAVSHHLRILKDNGLIESRREGKEVYYKAKDTEICRLLHQMIEEVMEIACPERSSENSSSPAETAKKVHHYLLEHISERITIEELSAKFLMNPTTLKQAFKKAYGASIAAHINEHRMKYAAKMLSETDKNIAEVAKAVGYESQSKFTAAFQKYYNTSPLKYKKQQ